jgi:hypothetical protein
MDQSQSSSTSYEISDVESQPQQPQQQKSNNVSKKDDTFLIKIIKLYLKINFRKIFAVLFASIQFYIYYVLFKSLKVIKTNNCFDSLNQYNSICNHNLILYSILGILYAIVYTFISIVSLIILLMFVSYTGSSPHISFENKIFSTSLLYLSVLCASIFNIVNYVINFKNINLNKNTIFCSDKHSSNGNGYIPTYYPNRNFKILEETVCKRDGLFHTLNVTKILLAFSCIVIIIFSFIIILNFNSWCKKINNKLIKISNTNTNTGVYNS